MKCSGAFYFNSRQALAKETKLLFSTFDLMNSYLFNFEDVKSLAKVPIKLNNPFGSIIPDVARSAASEFQRFIESESTNWEHDFATDKGKMFGVLVVELQDGTLAYLATVSGKLQGSKSSEKFAPSVFDDSTDDFFINKGMTELTAISNQIKGTDIQSKKDALIETRREKSYALQQRLFENYQFLNLSGETQNVLEIFENSSHGNPPAAAGECAAPKLLSYALSNNLNPIAIAEFWWGNSPKSEEREHLGFYPACKNKCRPILEFILEDDTLFISK
ncbi:MAG: tRNA pseudouridine32 synthase/23S rRNA pseudouridine746 synthase [Arenicella sp.]|jgi:tRNA pseudouridine32 synthase/23S rRNA pseudouridine746 synthase